MERNDGIKTKSSSLSTGGCVGLFLCVAVSGVLRSTMDMDFRLGEKIPTLYKDAATGAALRQLESTMKETDGNHWFACVQEVSSHKRSWEEETASHWVKRAQVQSGKTLKLNALNKSLFEQVDSIMEDDFRWRKRSTVLRGDYQVPCARAGLGRRLSERTFRSMTTASAATAACTTTRSSTTAC